MNSIDLKPIARLARLRLTESELEHFEPQVAQILSFVNKLEEVDVRGVQPTSHPLSLSNVFREDVPLSSLAVEPFLEKSPKSRGRFFEVPKIIEDK